MIFASKTPRDLNRDPLPYVVRDRLFDKDRYRQADGRLEGRDAETFEARHDPRPEYDHPQHNEPNPILVAFRGWLLEPVDLPEAAQWWLDQMTDGTREPLSSAYAVMRATSASAAEYDHARRVLTRLAHFAEQETPA